MAKSANTGSSEVSGTTCWPALIICPTFTWRIPSWPSKGATSVFFLILERIWSTTAFSLLNFDCAASSSAFESTFCDARPRVRSKSCRASSASASADRKSASSWEASSFMITSPFLATPPFSNLMSLTTPPSSAAMVAPCTAETEPIAESTGAQFSSRTSALETVCGGGVIALAAAIILKICNPLIPTSRMTSASRPPIARPHAPLPDLTFGFVETGLAISCIRWFAFPSKQEPPQPSCDFQLAGAPFRGGHLLWLQNVAHQHSSRDSKNEFRQFVRLQTMRGAFRLWRARDQIGHAIHRRLQNVAHQIGHVWIARRFRVKIDDEG